MARKFGKKNHVTVNPLNISLILMGTQKVGKTTILKEVAEELCGEEGYMFLEMFREKGAGLIEGIVSEDVPDWETFDEIVSDIEDNKTTDYKDLKLCIIDTWDNGLELAEQEAIRIWNKENPDKKSNNINAIYSGFNRGQDKAAELIDDMVYRLRAVGVQVWIIMHIKNKEVTDPVSAETFQQVTADISQRYFNKIKRNVDLIAVGYIDREIVKEKTGKKNVVTHKDEYKGVVKSEVRKIKFRDTGYAVDAGSRLSEIVEEIPFNSRNFIDAINDALKAELDKNGVSFSERKKEDDEKAAKREAEIAKAEVERASKKELDSIITQIKEYFVQKKDAKELESLKPIARVAKELGYDSPIAVDNIEDAKKILEMCV